MVIFCKNRSLSARGIDIIFKTIMIFCKLYYTSANEATNNDFI